MGRPGVMLTGNSCSHGPGRTSAAVEGALKDSQSHHLPQGPPNDYCTVSLFWASHVNGSCRFKVLLATGTWKGCGRAGEQECPPSKAVWGAFQAGQEEFKAGVARVLL